MKEFTVMFHSVEAIGAFASLVNRQPFAVQLICDENVLDASSVMNLCFMGLHKPMTLRLRDCEATDAFCREIEPYLVPKAV